MRCWLKKIREDKTITQEQVAEAAGISRAYYTRIENGGYDIPVDTSKKIATALGFDWTRFYERDSTPGAGDTEQPA